MHMNIMMRVQTGVPTPGGAILIERSILHLLQMPQLALKSTTNHSAKSKIEDTASGMTKNPEVQLGLLGVLNCFFSNAYSLFSHTTHIALEPRHWNNHLIWDTTANELIP